MSELTLKENKETVSNTPLSNAPIALVRPSAPQLNVFQNSVYRFLRNHVNGYGSTHETEQIPR